MGGRIHLSEEQRRTAVALFEVGLGNDAVASRLGVTASATGRLLERWQVRGAGALVAKTTKRSFSFEFKLEVVRRYLAGDKAVDLAREYDPASPGQVATWARTFRRDGEDALRPKPKGRRPTDPDAPVVHSDQGMHCQNKSWQQLLARAGATQSMSRKATCLDNTVIESFFGHLKEELFHHTKFTSVDSFTAALDEYLTWYNTDRISTKLKGLSPVQYRDQALAA